MKTCTKCGMSKPNSDFYRHIKMKDGFLSHCKECVKERVRIHRLANIDRVREYDRNRPNALERAEAGKERRKSRRYRRKYKEPVYAKYTARNRTNAAIRDGKLKPAPCERCGVTVAVQAHHDDYTKPLSVRWLCPKHHGERHRELNEHRRKSRHDEVGPERTGAAGH